MLQHITKLIAENEISQLKYYFELFQAYKTDLVFQANLHKLKGLVFLLMSRNDPKLPDVALKTFQEAKLMFSKLQELNKNSGIAQCCLGQAL